MLAVNINLHPTLTKKLLGPSLSKELLLESPPKIVTRRQLYLQIQAIFNPVGSFAPMLLIYKQLLMLTQENICDNLERDDFLPEGLKKNKQ